ncbi:hypothetical protein D9M68_590390 [compost metagenome]
MRPVAKAHGAADTATSLLRKFGYRSALLLSSPARWKLPACTIVTNGDAGRTLTSVDRRALKVLCVEVNTSADEPSTACSPGLARTLNLVLASPRSLTLSVCVASPTTSSPPEAVSVSAMGTSLPEPTMLFARPTPTSTVSPGAIASGAFGNITMSPRTTVRVLLAAVVSSFTATAITRRLPLKLSGTV